MIDQLSIDVLGLQKLIKDLRKINKDLYSPNLQVYRAQKFKQYTINLVKSNNAGLKPISLATQIISGEHDPMNLTGELLEHMAVRRVSGGVKGGYSPGNLSPNESAADVGYFPGSKKVPGKRITWTRLAILHHTGYRIPLTGEKGRRVRAWLAFHGVNLFGGMNLKDKSAKGPNRQWIIVPPRPYMLNSLEKYKREGKDLEAVKEFFDVLGSQIDTKKILDSESVKE